MQRLDLHDWIPESFVWQGGGPVIGWAKLGRERLLEPFFADTLQSRQLERRETSIDELLDYADHRPGLPLRGLIFHMSRCGSTLVSRMLAASPRNVVASEPPPLSPILDTPGIDRSTRIHWLRAMASALGQPRAGGEEAFYIKLDPWNIHHIDLLLEAFPETPWLFLYRQPLEVLDSQRRATGAWLVPDLLAPEVLGLTREDWQPQHLEVYAARALAGLCQSAIDAEQTEEGMLVNYAELPEAFSTRIAPHFDVPTEELHGTMSVADRDAKAHHQKFIGDSDEKRASATPDQLEAVSRYLAEPYAELEALRRMQLEP
jgi:hypothetical protein